MTDKILIIKLGALGDVIRTTPILRRLKGEITWVTAPSAMPLLDKNRFIKRLLPIQTALNTLRKESFRLVLNLEEDKAACHLAAAVDKKEFVGPYETPKGVRYTDSSKEWFDMSLISRFGKKKADKIKWQNRKSYQEILFKMVGLKFKGEEYVLPIAPRAAKSKKALVGLETRSGERWMEKRWVRFPEFEKNLKAAHIPYYKFREFPTLLQFMRHINKADAVVTSDSLALHIALGLRKKVVAFFTCTSPTEIYGYHKAQKVVSPLLQKYFYSTARSMNSGAAIPVEEMRGALDKLIS